MPVENVGSKTFTTPGLNHDEAKDWIMIIRAGTRDSTGLQPQRGSGTAENRADIHKPAAPTKGEHP